MSTSKSSRRTTFQGVIRTYGGVDKSSTVNPMPLTVTTVACTNVAVDQTMKIGTSPTTGQDFVLPKGAIMLSCQNISLNGGAATIDVGDTTDGDGFFDEINANAYSVTPTTAIGAFMIAYNGAGMPSDVAVTAEPGVTAGTGTAVLAFTWVPADNGLDGVQGPADTIPTAI